ncbi:MAG: nicotinamide-nucleotide amidohydrolase family protein [Actinomycetota bacterium]|nr:nicotinamide-nucleotide amidohydrolase family protein [Actinomycetota bacterium]
MSYPEGVEQAVAELLRNAHLTVATAESCTAGAVTMRLAAVPGASAYLRGGLVAYATEIKSSVLGLDRQLVDEHGPVSLPTTEAMARRAQALFDADLGLAVTCVAGPDPQGGRSVGTIVWALAARDGHEGSGEFGMAGDRPSIQRTAASVVLEALRRHLLGTRLPGGAA